MNVRNILDHNKMPQPYINKGVAGEEAEEKVEEAAEEKMMKKKERL